MDDEDFPGFVLARSGALLRLAYLIDGDEQLASTAVARALAEVDARWPAMLDPLAAEDLALQVLGRHYLPPVPPWRRRRSGRPAPPGPSNLGSLCDELPPEPAGPGPDLEHAEDDAQLPPKERAQRLVWPILTRLDRQERTLLVLPLLEGLEAEDTADLLGWPVARVVRETTAAFDQVRATLAAEIPELRWLRSVQGTRFLHRLLLDALHRAGAATPLVGLPLEQIKTEGHRLRSRRRRRQVVAASVGATVFAALAALAALRGW